MAERNILSSRLYSKDCPCL